jgi:beta-phosphoglucomutase-like phosphatase (HAD superfamily)
LSELGSELSLAVERLVNRVSRWTPPRWAASSVSGVGTRAEVMHALVQRVADLAAAAEGQPRRRVPRLDSDLALPDQLRVVAADLAAARPAPALLAEAARLVASTDP